MWCLNHARSGIYFSVDIMGCHLTTYVANVESYLSTNTMNVESYLSTNIMNVEVCSECGEE